VIMHCAVLPLVPTTPVSAAGLGEKLHGYENMKDFVQSLEKPR
jgi:hypothetical protein